MPTDHDIADALDVRLKELHVARAQARSRLTRLTEEAANMRRALIGIASAVSEIGVLRTRLAATDKAHKPKPPARKRKSRGKRKPAEQAAQ